MKADALITGLSVLLAGIVISAPAARSKLTSPATRAAGAALLAVVLALGGILIERLVFNAR